MKVIRKTGKIFLITLNVLFSLMLLLGCYGSFINQGDFWFLGLLNLFSIYLFVALLLFFIGWLFVKPWLSLISILSLLICVNPMLEVFTFNVNQSFDSQKKKNVIRLMSWNVQHFDILEHKQHPERKEEMISIINDFNPDIACFQEMVAGDSTSSSINYLPDFVRRFKMKEYHYSYVKKLDFDKKHHFGIITFSKYPIIKKETICISPNNYNSVFQYCDIVRETDTIRVFNIHLQSLKFTRDNRTYIDDPSLSNEGDIRKSKNILYKFKVGYIIRHRQSDAVRRAINQSPYPVMVCGDFNDVPNSYAYRTIGRGLKNAFRECGFGFGATFSTISSTLRIDNIFTDARYDILQYTCLNKKISDHYPIVADVRIRK